MSMDLSTVVTFRNISDETFTHAYGGVPYTFRAGETMTLPLDLGRHFAKHLARKILMADGENKMSKLNLPQYSPQLDKPLWGKEGEEELIKYILGEVSSAPVSASLSEQERIAERVKELNANKPAEVEPAGRTKAEVIEEMKKLGLPVDARKSMASLEEELKEHKSKVGA